MTLLARFKPRLPDRFCVAPGWRRFAADRRGTTAIEFAMIAVPFLGLIGAIFETGSVYFRTAQLQMATESASRVILTRSTAVGLTYKQFIEQNVCTWKASGVVKPGTLSKMFDCDKLLVDVSSPVGWSTANTNNTFTPAPITNAITMPGAGQVAVVRIVYPMNVISGFLGGGAFTGQTMGQIRNGQTVYSGKWSYMLMGISAFRVEP